MTNVLSCSEMRPMASLRLMSPAVRFFTSSSSKLMTFLPRCMECRRDLAIRILSLCLSVSVCPSVKRVISDKTEERSVLIFIPLTHSHTIPIISSHSDHFHTFSTQIFPIPHSFQSYYTFSIHSIYLSFPIYIYLFIIFPSIYIFSAALFFNIFLYFVSLFL